MKTTSMMSLALAAVLPLVVAACDAADGVQATTGSVAAEAAPAAGGTVDALPLRRGYYVRSDDACGKASHATLALVRRDGITGCDFTAIERIGESRYRVHERCVDRQGPSPTTFDLTQEYEVLAEDRYRVTYEYGESAEFGFCPQQSLPDPWNTNDISDVTG